MHTRSVMSVKMAETGSILTGLEGSSMDMSSKVASGSYTRTE